MNTARAPGGAILDALPTEARREAELRDSAALLVLGALLLIALGPRLGSGLAG